MEVLYHLIFLVYPQLSPCYSFFNCSHHLCLFEYPHSSSTFLTHFAQSKLSYQPIPFCPFYHHSILSYPISCHAVSSMPCQVYKFDMNMRPVAQNGSELPLSGEFLEKKVILSPLFFLALVLSSLCSLLFHSLLFSYLLFYSFLFFSTQLWLSQLLFSSYIFHTLCRFDDYRSFLKIVGDFFNIT